MWQNLCLCLLYEPQHGKLQLRSFLALGGVDEKSYIASAPMGKGFPGA